MKLPAELHITEINAPVSWRTVDFISDLHLSAETPATFTAWRRYLESTPADAVFILGDLFEAWVGDDSVSDNAASAAAPLPTASFEDRCARVLGQAAQRLALFFMHGNRDFLVGQRLMGICHASLLADPTVLVFEGQRWLLSHGDALCLDDVDYLQFRRQVRSPAWQRAFLARPLAERQAIARELRQKSQNQQAQRKQAGDAYADVDSHAARQWLLAANARTLIHGHTHQPAVHDLGQGLVRVVLSDWNAETPALRTELLRLGANGLKRIHPPQS
jgi:UDP-2,3-diacylglucosamine hydrolase